MEGSARESAKAASPCGHNDDDDWQDARLNRASYKRQKYNKDKAREVKKQACYWCPRVLVAHISGCDDRRTRLYLCADLY